MQEEELLAKIEALQQAQKEMLKTLELLRSKQLSTDLSDLIDCDRLKKEFGLSERNYYRCKARKEIIPHPFAGKDYYFLSELLAHIRQSQPSRTSG